MEFSIELPKKEEKVENFDDLGDPFGSDDKNEKSKNKNEKNKAENKEKNEFLEVKHMVNKSLKNQELAYKEKMAEDTAKILKVDPTIYEYDRIYDKIKQNPFQKNSADPNKKEPIKRDSRFMGDIIRENERRKREQMVMWERMEEKERLREAEKSGNIEEQRYFTSSYMKLQATKQKYEQIEKAEEEYNKKHTAQNAEAGMMGFYSKLLTDNVAVSGGKRGEIFNENPNKKYENITDKLEKKVDKKLEIDTQRKISSQKMAENKANRSRSRSHERLESEKIPEKSAEIQKNETEEKRKKEMEEQAKKAEKLKAAMERYKSRKSENKKENS